MRKYSLDQALIVPTQVFNFRFSISIILYANTYGSNYLMVRLIIKPVRMI